MPEIKVKNIWFLWIPTGLIYLFLAYNTERTDSLILIVSYVLLFGLFWIAMNSYDHSLLKKYINASIVLKALYLFSIPTLSDDIYRFIWDGHLILDGINPYSFVPSEFDFSTDSSLRNLYPHLNSPEYFSVYPPVAQWIFTLSALLHKDSIFWSVVLTRIFMLLAETGSLFLLLHITQKFRFAQKLAFFYALNPLVIIELSGNLHIEGFAIFFLLLALALIIHKRFYHAGAVMALSIGVKLLPAIFLPLFLKRLKKFDLIKFYSSVSVILVLIFIPFINSNLLYGFYQSLQLYFISFEFNASFYFIVREIGYLIEGYNIIEYAGPALSLLAFVSILFVLSWDWFRTRSFSEVALLIGLIYFLFSTTIHPWYITTLIAVGSLSKYRWPLLWSFFIFFSYLGYTNDGFSENYLVIAIEYITLLLYFFHEFRNNLRRKSLMTHEI